VDQPIEPATPGGELEQARSLLATGDARQALSLLKDWTEQNPDHERYHEGMFLLGEAYFETGDYYKAYEGYEAVVQSTSGDLFYRALKREMDVARGFLAGQKRIVWRILRLPAYDDGLQILDRVWEQVPGTRMGEEALKRKADYYFDNGDMDLAQDEYANLARQYPRGRFTRSAMLRSAEASNAAFPGIKFDDRALVESEERYKQVQAAYPDFAARENVDVRLEGIRQQRAEKDLSVARWYEKTKQAGAAEYYYKIILKEWPDTVAAAEARSRLRAMGVEFADNETAGER
jgi:outer membrane protein assembly factor BamD (BamD/ComL family)